MKSNADGVPTVDFSEIEVLDYRPGAGLSSTEEAWKVRLGDEVLWYERWISEHGSGSEWYSGEGDHYPDVQSKPSIDAWEIEVTGVPQHTIVEGEDAPVLVSRDGVADLSEIFDEYVIEAFTNAYWSAHGVLVEPHISALRERLLPFRPGEVKTSPVGDGEVAHVAESRRITIEFSGNGEATPGRDGDGVAYIRSIPVTQDDGARLTIRDADTGRAIGLLHITIEQAELHGAIGGWNQDGDWLAEMAAPLFDRHSETRDGPEGDDAAESGPATV